MAEIQFASADGAYCEYLIETFKGSGIFESAGGFIPTVFNVFFDPDRLTYRCTVSSLGTPVVFGERYHTRLHRISRSDLVYANLTVDSLGGSAYSDDYLWFELFPHDPNYSGNFNSPLSIDDIDNLQRPESVAYVGAFYHAAREKYLYILYYNEQVLVRTYDFSNSPVCASNFLEMFYGISSDLGSLEIKLISPQNTNFEKNVSHKIIAALQYDSGVTVPADIEYNCSPNTGWSWDDDTHTLKYLGGTWTTTVKARTTYEGEDYSASFVFKPTAGTSPYQPGGNSGFGGGNGNFGQDDRNDNVVGDIPGGSNFGYIGGSIFTHYALSGSQAMHFGEWLWTDDLGLSLWKTVMEKLFNETADALVSLMCFPFNISTLPGVSLGDGKIIAGNLNTGIPARVLGSPYASVNWGAVPLYEYWGNFLDYAPHTKLELYLPWSTGFVPLDPHQCVPGSVSVTTNIDLQKGTCTHNVFAGNTVLGVYEGQCGYEVPLLASNFSAKLAGATVAAVATAVTAGAAAAVGGASAISSGMAMKQVASHNSMIKSMMPGTARNMAGLTGPMTDPGLLASKNFLESQLQTASAPSPIDYSPISHGVGSKIASATSSATAKQPVNVSRNGSFSGSSAGMSVPYPFIVISRPEQNVPTGYGHHFGYPSNITSILGQLKGYTEVGAIHLNGLKALPDEIAELDDILKGGFII